MVLPGMQPTAAWQKSTSRANLINGPDKLQIPLTASASDSIDVGLEKVLDMSNNHLNLLLGKLWEYGQ